ncbi:hypothetical protein [Gandjariella thermophila]|uniref:Uncharacterized protein n=1 Tax=Gandjariella thermophila TaxID=1931992 RepID=A0A4D4J0F3_9PSEU|nr:hypothetical protein [Gandjariella thermophila]GDY30095.1 hypothetical protein GTS_17280 [Gandjariella thermophila]
MIEFRPVDEAPPEGPPALRISWVRLPMLWWRKVSVVEVDQVKLDPVDRFMVEAATKLGRLDAATFEDLTGLPELAFTALGRRLCTIDLLAPRDGDFVAGGDAARALDEGTVSQRRSTALDFLYLPETDDLLVVEDTLADFERDGPAPFGVAPIPAELHGTTLHGLLSGRIGERRVANLPASVVALDPRGTPDEPINSIAGGNLRPSVPVCPAVEGTATVLLDQERPQATLTVTWHRRGEDADAPSTVDISGAEGLIESWRRIAERPGEPEHRAAAVRALTGVALPADALRPAGPGCFSLALTGRYAQAVTRQGALPRRVGLEIRAEQVHLLGTVEFTPADDEAERIFALEEFVGRLAERPAGAVDVVAAEPETVREVGGPQAVWRRAWQLGHRRMVHALREAEDFDYARN